MTDTARQELRNKMSALRKDMTVIQVKDYSALIASRLSELEPVINSKRIMGFAAIRNEVELRPFLEAQQGLGKKILLPRIKDNDELEAVEVDDWRATRPGVFGIQEPSGPPCSNADIDVVLVPGLVFDAHGYRLGYGKGYYDRFLPLLPASTFICGVCYEFQVVDDIMPHSGDVPVHWIITEKSELAFNWDFF
ncbi:MAG: 5-formyltetrahydrofolate cyclo-ligase [Syntrophomonas sp.]|nr:5-formyltetrahydrofolate cyclo-ligase [Syntrophomonas sp.]